MSRPIRALAVFTTVLIASNILLSAQPEDRVHTARGFVFDDENRNLKKDPTEQGIEGVRISNGTELVSTDASGSYQISVHEGDILFVVKPRNWMSPLDENNLPQFYYAHKPKGSPELFHPGVEPTGPLPSSIDFPLFPRHEPDQLKVLLFGDTQTRDEREVQYLAHDVVEELIGSDAAFGVTLGDIVFDDLSIFGSVNATIGRIGIPWHNVIGNHDLNFDASSDRYSDETFESVYGPHYYSFDYGPTHFVVMDTVYYEGADPTGEKGDYHGGIDDSQLEFLKNDLELVPNDQLVVLLMHYPLVSSERDLNIPERHQVFPLLEGRPSLSVSGHRHYMEQHFIGASGGWKGNEPHHHLVNATVCGSWWRGDPDELGIPHATMSDGAPNGYSILHIDGNEYSIAFKAARRPADYQMHIFAPERIWADQAPQTEILVNVFAGSERSKVEMKLGVNGEWVEMQRVLREDPYYLQIKAQETVTLSNRRRLLPRPVKSLHLWRATFPADPPTGTQVIQVKTTDAFGQNYTANRVVKIR